MSFQNYQRTMAKLKHLEKLGYKVIHIWEHEFREFLKKNPILNEQIENHPFVKYSKLNARDGIYGGRNEAGCLYYKTKPNEKIKFVDFCSLYPYAMLTGKYFLREPKRIRMFKECANLTKEDLTTIDGLAYVTVLPNSSLFWPVLPCRINNKLMFVCCYMCAINSNVTQICTHSTEERSITGVYSTCELKEAFKQGYQLLKVFEIWEYDFLQGKLNESESNLTYEELVESKKAPQLNEGENFGVSLFTQYQNTFIQMKGEASGFPNACESEKQKQEYILKFYNENNVFLRIEKKC